MKYLDAYATISSCGTYRYRLRRVWDRTNPKRALFVMLNPSTADGDTDDPTIRKCVGFASRWGCGGIDVVNLFAFRATSPERLVGAVEAHGIGHAVGPESDAVLHEALSASVPLSSAPDARNVVVAAWGANAARRALRPRADHVRSRLRYYTAEYPELAVTCLGRAGDGTPRHPLMLPYSTQRVTW